MTDDTRRSWCITASIVAVVVTSVIALIVSRSFAISWVIDGGRGCCTTERSGVGLSALADSGLGGGIEKQFWIIGRVLSLNKSIQLRVLGSLLAEDGVPVSRWVRGKVLGRKGK